MSTQAVQPVHRFSLQSVLIALAGGLLAVVAGFGIAMLVLDDDPVATTPTTVVEPQGSNPGLSDFDNEREVRELMHRR